MLYCMSSAQSINRHDLHLHTYDPAATASGAAVLLYYSFACVSTTPKMSHQDTFEVLCCGRLPFVVQSRC